MHFRVETKYSARIGAINDIFESGKENVWPQTFTSTLSSPTGVGTSLSDAEDSRTTTVDILKMIIFDNDRIL
jgi:hypothetical protein